MSDETKYQVGDVVDLDGEIFAVVNIGPARTNDRVRYELRGETRRTLFRYVDVFDEDESVALLISVADELTDPDDDVEELTDEEVAEIAEILADVDGQELDDETDPDPDDVLAQILADEVVDKA